MAANLGVPVFTVESDRRTYGFATARLRRHRGVTLEFGDSRRFLRELIGNAGLPRARVFFYLDAHWGEDLPLVSELEIICLGAPEALIMIDDFQVPGDSGYGFDDFGPGRVLTDELIDPIVERFGLTQYYPAIPSAEETGARRGFRLLVNDPATASILDRLACLTRRSG